MNIITKLNIRQKVMLALTILAALFLTWQIYNFVRGPVSPVQASIPAPLATVSPAPPAAALHVVAQLPVNNPSYASMVNNQQEYLNMVRDYQVAKMKRQILEEQAGIATAQKRISEARGSDNFGSMEGTVSAVSYGGAGYQLAYLDRQAGRWTATLSQGGQYKEVYVGTRLGDGATVASITDRGVVLHPVRGKNLVLSFQGSVNVEVSVPASKVKQKSTPVVASLPASAPASAPASVPAPAPASANNSNNAKIAKMLGMVTPPANPTSTTTFPTEASVPTPVAPPSVTDIPAAPLTVTQEPVSVKEFRDRIAQVAVNENDIEGLDVSEPTFN